MSLTWHLIMARSGHKERLRSHLSALQNPLLSSLSPALSSFSLSLSLSRFLSRSKTFGPSTRFPVSSPTVFWPARSHHRTEDTDHCNFLFIFLQEAALLLLLFLPRFLLSCRPQFRRSACLRGPSPRISVLLGPVSVFFLVRFLNVCVCVFVLVVCICVSLFHTSEGVGCCFFSRISFVCV